MNEKLSWISGMTKKMHKSLVRLTKDNFLEEISLEQMQLPISGMKQGKPT